MKQAFFIFAGHPGNFFRSAMKYHNEGHGEWVKHVYPQCCNGMTFYEALQKSENEEDRMILTMKYFGNEKKLLQREANGIKHLKEKNKRFTVHRCGDLWKYGDVIYFEKIATQMTHGSFSIQEKNLMEASPIKNRALFTNSTGAFNKQYFEGYNFRAKGYYQNNFKDWKSR